MTLELGPQRLAEYRHIDGRHLVRNDDDSYVDQKTREVFEPSFSEGRWAITIAEPNWPCRVAAVPARRGPMVP